MKVFHLKANISEATLDMNLRETSIINRESSNAIAFDETFKNRLLTSQFPGIGNRGGFQVWRFILHFKFLIFNWV